MKAFAVIGAQYGQEGKSVVSRYLAGNWLGRFNSDYKCEHLSFAPNTWLSSGVVCSPTHFFKELAKIAPGSEQAQLHIHPDCQIVTPYDLYEPLDTFYSEGLVETLRRHEVSDTSIHLRFKDLKNIDYIRHVCANIRNFWLPARLEHEVGCLDVSDFIDLAHRFYLHNRECVAPVCESIVFEGCHGLMLDPRIGTYPHVVPYHVGLRGLEPILQELKVLDLDIFYVAQCHVRVWGKAALKNEINAQRHAHLDLNVLSEAIISDFADISLSHSIHIVFTCCPDTVDYRIDNILYQEKRIKFLIEAQKFLQFPVFYTTPDNAELQDVSLLRKLKNTF